MTPLIQCIYSSVANQHFSEEDLPRLLTEARSANAAHAITGMLVYINGHFLQVMEGPEAAVNQLLANICNDPRHEHVLVIARKPVAARSFGDWSMGFKAFLVADLEALIGENDFFDSGSCIDAMDAGIVKRIFASFLSAQDRII